RDSGTGKPPMPMPSSSDPSHALGRFGTGAARTTECAATCGDSALDRHARAADLDAAHQAAERAGVAQRDVLGAAIVPEGDRAVLPAEAEGEFRPVAMLEQKVEQ